MCGFEHRGSRALTVERMVEGTMAGIQQGDRVRWKEAAGSEVGIVYVVRDHNGDAHVRFPNDGMNIIPTSELILVTEDESDDGA